MRLAILLPLALVSVVAALTLVGVVEPLIGRYALWIYTAAVGTAFLVHYTAQTRWPVLMLMRDATEDQKEIGRYQREVVIWSSLVTGIGWLVVISVLFGPDWIPRDVAAFAVVAASTLAMSRRYALYLRSRRRERRCKDARAAVKVAQR